MNRWTINGLMAAAVIGAFLQTACANQPVPPTEATPQAKAAVETSAAAEQANTAESAQNQELAKADKKSAAKQGQNKETNVLEKYRGLVPFNPSAPAITEYTTIDFETSDGLIVMEIYPQAAPNAAKRFIELCKAGFYDNTPIFRVVKSPQPFVAQFGINWRPGMVEWKDRNFNDDPSLFQLNAGTLAFAKAGPNTNSTQVFINYGDNNFLKDNGGFSTFGRIIKGFEIAAKFKAVGNPSMGLDQQQLWTNGEKYLKMQSAQQQPTMIIKASVAE